MFELMSLGASVAPQLLGIMSDKFGLAEFAKRTAQSFNIRAEQVGMRAGLITAGLFPLAGVLLLLHMKRYFKRNRT